MTYFDAEIVDQQPESTWGVPARTGEAAPDQPERRRAGGLHSRGRTAVVAMVEKTGSQASQQFSIVSGPPLADEPGLGALTLPGFLREVTQEYGEREALVFHNADGVTRWTYAQLWERAIEVARALRRVRRRQGRPRRCSDDKPAGMACRSVRYIAGRRGGRHPQHILHSPRTGLSDTGLRCFGVVVRAQGAVEGLRRRSGRAGTGDRHSAARCAGIG